MTEKCEYFLEIEGKRIKLEGHLIQVRDNGYTLIWDDKYGDQLIKNKDVIRDTEWKRMKKAHE